MLGELPASQLSIDIKEKQKIFSSEHKRGSSYAPPLEAAEEDLEEMSNDHLTNFPSNTSDIIYYPRLIAGEVEGGNKCGRSKTEALFHNPIAISLHRDGSLFVADTENGCVKKLSTDRSVVVTIADKTDGLKTPTGIACCPLTGEVFVSDVDMHCIFRMKLDSNQAGERTGVLEVISGQPGICGYYECDGSAPKAGDASPASVSAKWDVPWAIDIDPANGDIVVCDKGNHCVRRILMEEYRKSSETDMYPISPASRSRLRHAAKSVMQSHSDDDCTLDDTASQPNTPDAEMVDDLIFERIRILAWQPKTVLLAGTVGVPGLSDSNHGGSGGTNLTKFKAPSAIAVGLQGNIFVSDIAHGRIRMISKQGLGAPKVVTIPGLYSSALGLSVDAYGRLYISNSDEKQLLRYDPPYCMKAATVTSMGDLVVLPTSTLQNPVSVCIDSASGQLYIADHHAIKAVEVTKCLPPINQNLSEDLEQLLLKADQDDSLADTVLSIGQKSLKAHKAIIATRCPALKDVVNKGSSSPIDIMKVFPGLEGVSYSAFSSLLFFLYTDRCILSRTTRIQVLQASHVLGLPRLKCLVEEYLVKRLTLDNVLDILKAAHQFKADRLKKACIMHVVEHFASLQEPIAKAGLNIFPELLTELLLAMPN